jgi:Na+-transporting NADH:ubiquinone oxidoreductase subunit NqrD
MSIYIYLLLILALKGYTLFPKTLSHLIAEEKLDLCMKRSEKVAWLLVTITLILLIFVGLQTLSGLVSVVFGESFYEAFTYKNMPPEAYYDGIEDESSFSEFRFSIRAIIINFLVCKPLFGIGLLEKYLNGKSK